MSLACVPAGSALPLHLTSGPGWLFSHWVWRAGESCGVGLRAELFEEGWASGQSLLCPGEGVSRAGGGGGMACSGEASPITSLPVTAPPPEGGAGVLLVALVFRQDPN